MPLISLRLLAARPTRR